MSLKTKRIIIALLAACFVLSLLFVQWMEILRKKQEAGLAPQPILVPATSKDCVDCHTKSSPGIVEQKCAKGAEETKILC